MTTINLLKNKKLLWVSVNSRGIQFLHACRWSGPGLVESVNSIKPLLELLRTEITES